MHQVRKCLDSAHGDCRDHVFKEWKLGLSRARILIDLMGSSCGLGDHRAHMLKNLA